MNSYGASTRLVPISLTLVIPKNIGGLIVGQGGKNIKDLRVNSGAQIIFSAEEPFKIMTCFYEPQFMVLCRSST